MKKALITGITGQDGSYLAEFLLEKGYEVHGIVRRESIEDPTHRLSRLSHFQDKLQLHAGSIESYPSLFNILQKVQPTEIYHLAAQSFVSSDFEDEFATLNTNINGTHYLLVAIKQCAPDAKLYFAGSSEMFGRVEEEPQNERSRFNPRSAYGISKVSGYHLVRNYREAYGLFTATGFLYNHESPRRGYQFVTRKITSNVAKISLGLADELSLGSLDAIRDWGHAKDYIKAMWLMLQQDEPQDFVIATGKTHSVQEFCEKAFSQVGLDYQKYVKIDSKHYRPSEKRLLVGDASRAEKVLGWKREYDFDQLVKEMVESDIKLLKHE